MTAPTGAAHDRIMTLLAERATQGLSTDEMVELCSLLHANPGVAPEGIDLAAAAAASAWVAGEVEEMPAEVRRRVQADASAWLAGAPPEARGDALGAEAPEIAGRIGGGSRLAASLGWLAAAAAIALAAVAWLRGPTPPGARARTFDEVAAGAGTVRMPWTPGPDPSATGVAGEVVWNDGMQAGYMVFRGLPRLDPAVGTYQLWIFDPTRDDKAPIDGGVFNVDAATGEARIAMDPRLPVRGTPGLFAVTVERPGGVVVSDRSRLVALAQKG